MAVSTGTISDITYNSAKVSGQIVDLGEGVNQHGHCYGKTPNMLLTNTDFKTELGIPNTGSFTSPLVNLEAETKYYVKAYLTNGNYTAYGEEKEFSTDPAPIKDKDGNVYNVIRIGTQLWMKENLKTTRYNDNTSITLVPDNTAWNNLTSPGYCWYINDAAGYKATYGGLYNWYTVNTGKLCPEGWHVPTDAEWTTLTDYLGGTSVAVSKLKEAGTAHWNNPNTGATNESGFTALPGGHRDEYGKFNYIVYSGYWWSSTETSTTYAWIRLMNYTNPDVIRLNMDKKEGFSVRCLRD